MTSYEVTKAYVIDGNGNDKHDGWDLLAVRGNDKEWCNRFATKRDAITAKRALEEQSGERTNRTR